MKADRPIAITRRGDTIGYFLPARPRRTEADRQALSEAHEKVREELAVDGITEDEIIEDFNRWRKERAR